jgi:hypothetical protein
MRLARCVTILGLAAVAGGVHAQSAPSGKSLAATMNVYVFPNNGQSESQQSKDEGECYNWAVSNTGTDPFDLQKKQSQQQQQTNQQVAQAQESQKGAGGRGFVGGAAAGALIGEIANDDAGQGAAWGAALGAMSSRRHAAARSQQAASSAEKSGAQKQAATAEQIENFKKAMSVCLESKKYMVKY